MLVKNQYPTFLPIRRRCDINPDQFYIETKDFWSKVITICFHSTPERVMLLSMSDVLHHIELYVSDLERSRQFYDWLLKQLGWLDFQDWELGHSWIKNDTYLCIVQTEEDFLTPTFHRKRVGLNHLAFHVDSRDEILAIQAELVKRQVPQLYEDRFPHAGGNDYFALFFEDPDRLKLELVAP